MGDKGKKFIFIAAKRFYPKIPKKHLRLYSGDLFLFKSVLCFALEGVGFTKSLNFFRNLFHYFSRNHPVFPEKQIKSDNNCVFNIKKFHATGNKYSLFSG